MFKVKVLLVDPDRDSLARLARDIETFGFEPIKASSPLEGLDAMQMRKPEIALVDVTLEGITAIEFCQRLRDIDPNFSLALLSARHGRAAEVVSERAGAEDCLIKPVRSEVLQHCLRNLSTIHKLKIEMEHCRQAMEEAQMQAMEAAPFDPRTKFYQLDLFKRLAMVEIKRARRYHYPLSLMLLYFDGLKEVSRALSPAVAQELKVTLCRAVATTVRDLDIPVAYSEDHLLVLMPHTAKPGAEMAAGKVRDQIKELALDFEGQQVKVTTSIGIAAAGGEEEASLATLVKQAADVLEQARQQGGDQVVVA